MRINEIKTNIENVRYDNSSSALLPLVKFKILSEYFFASDCILVSFDDKIFEAYKVFQYDFSKINTSTFSYSVYEFKNSRKSEYIIRIVEWNREKTKESIFKKSSNEELNLNSAIYYINNALSPEIRKLLKKIRSAFKIEPEFEKVNEEYFNRKIYIDYRGFSKCYQWEMPLGDAQKDKMLDEIVMIINDLASKVDNDVTPNVEIIFDFDPCQIEKLLF